MPRDEVPSRVKLYAFHDIPLEKLNFPRGARQKFNFYVKRIMRSVADLLVLFSCNFLSGHGCRDYNISSSIRILFTCPVDIGGCMQIDWAYLRKG